MALQLDPVFDAQFPCPLCDFVAHGPGALDEHLETHNGPAESVAAVPVDEVAGPITPAVVPVKTPKTFTCSTCGEKFVGYGIFMTHKRQEAKRV